MAKKLKAGIVGTGIIGKSHIRGYKGMDEVVRSKEHWCKAG